MKKKIILFIIFIYSIFFLFAEEIIEREDMQRPKVGLVLSGGGARGIAHIGVLKVLEEAGIKVDYITGTSMGSIIGALLAVGYTPTEMEKIILSQNWDEILLDEISLRSISIEEKDEWGKYVGSFPIKEGKIRLPVGLVAGQQVHSLINKLSLNVHHIQDFSKLPIPFLCIGTDIETGEAVVLKEGFLPDAVRASMSIPSMFAPIELDGRLLVDGGLVRNFPVSDVIGMGADIVIGVDVGAALYTKDQLYSLVRIMNQSITFQGVKSTEEERKLCDILIEPALDNYSIMDFRKTKELLTLGEKAGRKMLPQLKQLQKKLDKYPDVQKVIPLTDIKQVLIRKIVVKGLQNVSKNLILGKLRVNKDRWISIDDLAKAVERVYGSQYFNVVTYKLVPVNNGVELHLRVVEKSTNYLNFGFHYDSDMNASILINATLRNKLIMGSKLSMSVELSENSAYEASYFVYTGLKPGFGFGLSQQGEKFKTPRYENSQKIGIFDYSTTSSSIDTQTIFSNSFTVGGGLEFSHTVIKPDIMTPDAIEIDYHLFSYQGYCLVNTYDRVIYPRKGIKLIAEVRRSHELQSNFEEENTPITSYLLRCTVIKNLMKNIVFEETIYLGTIKGKTIPVYSNFYLGGIYEQRNKLIPFAGHKFASINTTSMAILVSAIRAEIKKNLYLTTKVNYARTGNDIDELINNENNYLGYAFSIGIMTPIGPFEVTASKSNDNNELLISTAIGFKF